MLDRAWKTRCPICSRLLGIVEGDDPLAQMDGQVKKRRTLEPSNGFCCANRSISR